MHFYVLMIWKTITSFELQQCIRYFIKTTYQLFSLQFGMSSITNRIVKHQYMKNNRSQFF